MIIGYLLTRGEKRKFILYYLGVTMIALGFIGATLITTLVIWVDFPKQAEILLSILLWVFSLRNIAVVISVVFLVFFYRSVTRWFANKNTRNFANHMNKITRNRVFSSTGMIFLEKCKKYPPFLGIVYNHPILSAEQESVITEYFRANDFVNKNKNVICGGGTYVVQPGDTWQSISKSKYKRKKFAKQLQESNSKIKYLRAAMVLALPRIDISELLGMNTDQIENKYRLAEDTSGNARNTIVAITGFYSLINEEALILLRAVYDAAQLTKNE